MVAAMVEATHVSVDLDGIGCYHAIHGLRPPVGPGSDAALRRCLPRFLEIFAKFGVRATFFVIGADLRRELDTDGAGVGFLRDALAAGHELANHSYAHRYDLVRATEAAMQEDVSHCDRVLRELGTVPTGFRAPGYTHDERMLGAVAAAGYQYDSSALPSPTYYLAKLAAIGWHRLRGRHSQSLVHGAGSFLGQRVAHVHRKSGLVELPISTFGPLRLPLVGTFLLAGPGVVRRALRRGIESSAAVHLELHALDLVDETADGIDPALARVQPELRTPLELRRERLAEFLAERGHYSRLCDAAAQVSREPR